MNKVIRAYDIEQYAAKGASAIDQMMATQQAGKRAKGSKHDVCMAMREKLKMAFDAGYTVQQIADALKDGNVFGILPKTILGIVKGAKKPVAVKKEKVSIESVKAPKVVPKNAQSDTRAVGTESSVKFNIQPDKKDL